MFTYDEVWCWLFGVELVVYLCCCRKRSFRFWSMSVFGVLLCWTRGDSHKTFHYLRVISKWFWNSSVWLHEISLWYVCDRNVLSMIKYNSVIICCPCVVGWVWCGCYGWGSCSTERSADGPQVPLCHHSPNRWSHQGCSGEESRQKWAVLSLNITMWCNDWV